jgi:hypothetical protein
VRVFRAAGVLAREQGDEPEWLGTAFAFRDASHYLTASHCVPDVLPSGLTVSLASGVAGMGFVGRVRSVVRHPSADVAVLTIEGDPPGSIEDAAEPFQAVGFVGREMAEEFLAFGYPMSREPAPTFPGIGPTPRVFVGHYQRTFPYRERLYEFEAGELSIAAPEGLSGAPLFNRERPSEVQAVVVGNHEERTERTYEERFDDAGEKHTHATYGIVSYGVALLLDPLSDWLDEHLPTPARIVE